MFIHKIFGSGKGGCSVAEKLRDDLKLNSFLMDLAEILTASGIKDGNMVVNFDGKGTGRNPVYGEKIVENNINQLRSSIQSFFYRDAESKNILYVVGAGGGSGVGFFYPVINILTELKKNIIVLVILPDQSESTQVKVNAVNFVSNMIDLIAEKENVTVILADNEYMLNRCGRGRTKYEKVNEAFSEVFKKMSFINNKDLVDGGKDIDFNDISSVLFTRKTTGFVDLRSIEIKKVKVKRVEKPKTLFKKEVLREDEETVANSESYLCKYDITLADKFIGYCLFPDVASEYGLAGEKVDKYVTPSLHKELKTNNGLITYTYAKINSPEGFLIVSGLTKSDVLNSLIKLATKEVKEIQNKTEKRKVTNIEKINF